MQLTDGLDYTRLLSTDNDTFNITYRSSLQSDIFRRAEYPYTIFKMNSNRLIITLMCGVMDNANRPQRPRDEVNATRLNPQGQGLDPQGQGQDLQGQGRDHAVGSEAICKCLARLNEKM